MTTAWLTWTPININWMPLSDKFNYVATTQFSQSCLSANKESDWLTEQKIPPNWINFQLPTQSFCNVQQARFNFSTFEFPSLMKFLFMCIQLIEKMEIRCKMRMIHKLLNLQDFFIIKF